jgi:hypothetical protein
MAISGLIGAGSTGMGTHKYWNLLPMIAERFLEREESWIVGVGEPVSNESQVYEGWIKFNDGCAGRKRLLKSPRLLRNSV